MTKVNGGRPHWISKFTLAVRGGIDAVRTQSSFWVHLTITAAVLVLATSLRIEPWRWVAIVFAITVVLAAELLNTAIELLVAVLHPSHDRTIGRALDTSAAAVLVAALGSTIVGLIVLGPPLWNALFS